MLKKGSKATFLIPSSLAYGKSGREPGIKPNENLLFEIEVLDTLSPQQYESMQMSKQQEQMALQQRMQQEAMKSAQEKAQQKQAPAAKK